MLSLGQRIKRAMEQGRCRKDRQFVIGVSAGEMGPGDFEEPVLIQGIIDAYLEEDDGLVLIDYKTDRAEAGREQELAKRYRTQLDYNQRALEQMTGKLV